MPTLDLTLCKQNPTLLDDQYLDNGSGKLVAMFGLGGELFVAPRERSRLREDMLRVQEDYFNTFSNQLEYCRFDTEQDPDGRIMKINGNPFQMIREGIGNWPADRGYSNIVFKKFKRADFPRSDGFLTPYVGSFLVEAEKDEGLSNYAFYLPVAEAGTSSTNFGTMRDSLLKWCSIVQPAHGLAGFSVVLEVAQMSGEPYAYSALQRYPGLNFTELTSFPSQAESTHNRIKSINWLTVIGDAVLRELGGRYAANNALGSECIIHDYQGGIVIQAGEAPQLGDTYVGDIPELYKRVSDFTKPVRFEAYRSSLFRVFKPLVGAEEAVRWVRRFD